MAREVIDSIPDLYGDEIEVVVIDGLVTLSLPTDISAVALDAEGQERFAKAYVCAHSAAAAARAAEAAAVANESTATGDELRVAIHAHLRRYPGLTAFEIARALGFANPTQGGASKVRRHLRAMREDGEAESETGRRHDGDPRPATRWRAT